MEHRFIQGGDFRDIKFHSRLCQNFFGQPKPAKPIKKPTFDVIVNFAANACGATQMSIMSKSRHEEDLMSRMLIWTYQDSNLKYSLSLQGFLLGNKNHATVLSSRRRYTNLIDVDKRLQNCQQKFVDLINQNFPDHQFIMKKRE